MSDRRHLNWLQKQFPQWLESQLIDQDQVNAIAQYYQEKSAITMGRSVFSALGAVLFGLGIILFFAYNWQDMHRFTKLALIFAFIISANLGSLWFAAPVRKQMAPSEGLALLGTLLFGAAIWLISQIYHIDEHYPNAFWAWGAAATAMGWARLSALQCLAGIVLLFIWGWLEVFEFSVSFHTAPWWLLFGAASLAWVLRSAWLLFLAIVAFCFLWVASMVAPLDETVAYFVLAISVFLVQFGLVSDRIEKLNVWNFRHALILPGFAVYLALVYIMTFVHLADSDVFLDHFDTTLKVGVFWASLTTSFAMPVLSLLCSRRWPAKSGSDTIHTVLMLFMVFLAFMVGPGWMKLSHVVLSGMMNLVFLGHCLLFILDGSKVQRGWEVALGCLLFAALVFARYVDLFDSLLSRAMVFLLLGAGLYVVGNFYSRHKQGDAAP